MLARLSTIFAQQKALVTRLSRPLPMTPDDINVVRNSLLHDKTTAQHASYAGAAARKTPLPCAGPLAHVWLRQQWSG